MTKFKFQGCTILLLEDEPLINFELETLFTERGAAVLASSAIKQAIVLASHPDLSAAVLDVNIRDETCAEICAKLNARKIPFVFHTAVSASPVLDHWPTVTIVPKPAAFETLVEAIGEQLVARGAGHLFVPEEHTVHCSHATY